MTYLQNSLKLCHHFLKNYLVKKKLQISVKFLPLSIKSINPIQKYSHIIESYACILKTCVTTVDLSINFLISFGMCSTPKLSK